MSKNDITGDSITTKYSKKFEDNFDKIFRNKPNKSRIDIIGQNGNTGEHYEQTKDTTD